MDRTDGAAAGPGQSQSRLSPVLLWIVAAAVLFRIVTAVMDRQGGSEGGGLVQWQPPGKAVALAQASGKPILYDFTAAWCGPCKLLDRDWSDPAVAKKVNEAFVPARVVDRAREDGVNSPEIAELQQRFEVVGFPTVAAASADGRLIAKFDGYRGREALLRFLEESRKPRPSP